MARQAKPINKADIKSLLAQHGELTISKIAHALGKQPDDVRPVMDELTKNGVRVIMRKPLRGKPEPVPYYSLRPEEMRTEAAPGHRPDPEGTVFIPDVKAVFLRVTERGVTVSPAQDTGISAREQYLEVELAKYRRENKDLRDELDESRGRVEELESILGVLGSLATEQASKPKVMDFGPRDNRGHDFVTAGLADAAGITG